MSDRHTASTINDIQLDELYGQLEQLRAALARTRAYAQTEQSLGNAIWPDDLLAVLNDQGGTSAAEAPDRIAVLQNRVRLANQARRAKEHQLDDIRRALCDIGFMQDDDPYSHADLAGVIRQNGPAATEATERPTLRERHRAQWLALTDDEQAARIAALDEDDEPEQPERTTPDNSATSSDEADNSTGAWTPDPPLGCLTVTTEPDPSQRPGLREQLHAVIESEMYEYRERTMFWEEGGVTTEIARLATRGAMEVRDAELEQLRAKVAEFDHIINWHTTCASCARILDSAHAETVRAETAEQRRDQLAGTLGEVLRHFVHQGHPGEPCLGVGWVSVRTVDRWRGILNPPTPPSGS